MPSVIIPCFPLHCKTKTGWTPLHRAAERGNNDLCVFLLTEAEADGNAPDNEGMTPLHWAATSGHSLTARSLIQHGGARVDLPDCTGNTPAQVASKWGFQHLAARLNELTLPEDATEDEKLNALPPHSPTLLGWRQACLASQGSTLVHAADLG